MSELGDKVGPEDKTKIQAGIDKLRETMKGSDIAAIKSATEELTQAVYAVSEKIYQQNPGAAQGGPQAGPGGPDAGAQGGAQSGQQYYDADYKVVDDDDKKNGENK
ncbi:Chaperone protein DnaK [bioreactor metagenome]|uniref:Chaperone protein DnaK n=1 Tax=bioreactor metagenome TaxID=1076179 RepID=A0A645JLZ3_9ZZZZ